MSEVQYKRVLLKVSGEALAGEAHRGLDFTIVNGLCRDIKACVELGVQVGLVIGAGNFWRGVKDGADKMQRSHADAMGMLGTVMNAIAVADVLNQYGNHLKENQPVVIIGRLSMREDKEAQIMINRARPMSDFTDRVILDEPEAKPVSGTLYLRLPSESNSAFRKVKAIINMFPGSSKAVVYFADTKQRRGTRCAIMDSMLAELKNVLGEANVVLK